MKTGLTRNEERVDHLFERISRLIEQARSFVVTSVNKAEVRTRFEVGRYIFEDEQQGERAEYGKRVLKKLSDKLTNRFGKDWTVDTLTRCRKFYMTYSAQRQILATTLPKSQNIENEEYASQYQLYLPDKAMLQNKLRQWIDEFNNNEFNKQTSENYE